MRKGNIVRYIGKQNELMYGKLFEVHKKSYESIEVSALVKYLDGSVHTMRAYMPISDFELVAK